jgi:transcriptional regulator with XRE-family HTH domain
MAHRKEVHGLSIAEVIIREAKQNGLKQNDMAALLHRSKQGISAAKTGRRDLSIDELLTLAEASGSGKAYMVAVHDKTPVFTSPYLDGEMVDHHRCSVLSKTIEELQEALEAAESIQKHIINSPRPGDEVQARSVKDSLLQLLDARVAIDHIITALSETYELNIAGLFAEHERKLAAKGYLKKKKPPLQRRG